MRLGFKERDGKVIPIVAETGEEIELVENCNVCSSIDGWTHATITYAVHKQESERITNDDRLAAREEAG